MAGVQIHMFPCLKDNYGFLIHDPLSGETASIDTPETEAILAAAAAKGWSITQIWNTHWHPDHAGGNAAIKAATGCVIYGPKGEAAKIPMIDHAVDDGDHVRLGQYEARVLNVGGHTMGHIAYHFPAESVAFVGDTLFGLGCGRVFEGTPQQMWTSLSKLAALPPETTIYCAHEYTQSNARFAITIEPGNIALQARTQAIDAARAKGEATVPTSIAAELASNPFLRADTQKSARPSICRKRPPGRYSRKCGAGKTFSENKKSAKGVFHGSAETLRAIPESGLTRRKREPDFRRPDRLGARNGLANPHARWPPHIAEMGIKADA